MFYSLDDAALIWACIEPAIHKIRGKNFTIKTETYARLSMGQKALLMFQIIYGHTSTGIEEFYCLVPYLPSKKGIWQELKNGMQHFGDDSMLSLLGEMEKDYNALEEKSLTEGIERLDICIQNLDNNSEIFSLIRQHDMMFHKAVPETLKIIGAYIRNNPVEFVRFEK